MPTSNNEFGETTTGAQVVSAYAEAVKDKIILITGANPAGIGGSTAVSLARASPRLLILAGRNPSKLAETTANVQKANPNVTCKSLDLDLSSQESVRKAAKEILEDDTIPHIDILINNAGVMNIAERTLSPEGIEMQFATNHIGHFLFTNLIMQKIEASAKSGKPGTTRIINLSSRAVVYSGVRFSDWNHTKKEAELPEDEHLAQEARVLWNQEEDKPYVPQAAYGQSKSANVLFTIGLNKRLHAKTGILSVAVHPGGIMTELGRHTDLAAAVANFKKFAPNMHWKNLEEGCSTTLVAALDPGMTEKDMFLGDCQVADWAPAWATDADKAEKLWQLSEEIVGQHF